MIKTFTLVAACLAVSACAPFIPVADMESLPVDKREDISKLQLYSSQELAALQYSNLGTIEGYSCKALLWSPGATEADAVRQVKYWALQKGANGITNLKCGSKEGTSFSKNCWESIHCSAQAIKVHN